jgi:uncharacterized OsmC-like protein
MEALIEYLGAAQFEIHARGHRIFSDQPPENGGFDEGMTPPELMLASLGSCAAYYAVEYLKARRLSTEGVRVRVTAEKAKAPARLAAFHLDIDIPGGLDVRHREGVLRAAKNCLIHNTLLQPPELTIDVNESPASTPLAA